MEKFERSEVEVLVAAHDGDGPELRCGAEHRRHLDDLDVVGLGDRRTLSRQATRPVEMVGLQLVGADPVDAPRPSRH
jgi:hypothetical protein